MPEPLWTPRELSDFLKVPEKTLAKWRGDGIGPRWRKVGRHVRYFPDSIANWVASQENTTAEESS